MGYRKAAMMRRRQYVRGHYRTSKNGKTYYVSGHVRNDSEMPQSALICLWLLLAIPAFLFAHLSLGVTVLIWFLFSAVVFSDGFGQKKINKSTAGFPEGSRWITERMYEFDGKYFIVDPPINELR